MVGQHPRGTRLLLPTYGPRAHPIKRAFGKVHDLCTRNHTRERLQDLVVDMVEHFHVHGLWQYKLSELYYDHVVTAAVERMARENTLAATGWMPQSHMDRFRAPLEWAREACREQAEPAATAVTEYCGPCCGDGLPKSVCSCQKPGHRHHAPGNVACHGKMEGRARVSAMR